ncbi:MAG: hypothetical protein P1V97_29815, partial [Planctomycetota bacterium]|nr:hypothetical protein [Planctomycetota bacterium]
RSVVWLILGFQKKGFMIMAKSYYQQIQGKKFKRSLIDMAKECVSGKGDGRISLGDAKKLFNKAQDGRSYTKTEKETVKYIRDNFKWTKQADQFFRKETRRVSVTRGLLNKMVMRLSVLQKPCSFCGLVNCGV